MKVNYQLELDKIISEIEIKSEIPTLLLHSCCAPCSSYVLEYLSNYFKITILYYNPNIYPKREYDRRRKEQQELIDKLVVKNKVEMLSYDYNSLPFFEITKGLENLKEGDIRCHKCYKLRLEEAATVAKDKGFDYFTTTLSISPHKDSQIINQIGKELEEKYKVNYLYSDFKKKEGYKRSIELSKDYGLYRQDYCGCIFSITERKQQDEDK
ncbi:MAG: epoxyqueuosine reductase QueH [Bacilli bacterium]|nr:epoxyqueuosine reductase QueH [Bacilli bacterium]